jgi:MoaA/NifB/PqqE/SkfB family radical SAM enzyme
MDISLYKNILGEAIDLGIKQVGLFSTGESILHPDIVEFIKISKSKSIYTYLDINGNEMDDGLIENIVESGLDSLKFSIDAHTQEIYKEIRRGGNFDVVFENLKKVSQLRNKKGAKMRLSALYIIMNKNEQYIEQFKEKIEPYVDEIQFSLVHNLGNQVKGHTKFISKMFDNIIEMNKTRRVCPNPWKRIVVSWDGFLTVCCIDFDLKLVYGKYEKGKLKEIWNNDKIKEFRKKMRDLNLSDVLLCGQCSDIALDTINISAMLNDILNKKNVKLADFS